MTISDYRFTRGYTRKVRRRPCRLTVLAFAAKLSNGPARKTHQGVAGRCFAAASTTSPLHGLRGAAVRGLGSPSVGWPRHGGKAVTHIHVNCLASCNMPRRRASASAPSPGFSPTPRLIESCPTHMRRFSHPGSGRAHGPLRGPAARPRSNATER